MKRLSTCLGLLVAISLMAPPKSEGAIVVTAVCWTGNCTVSEEVVFIGVAAGVIGAVSIAAIASNPVGYAVAGLLMALDADSTAKSRLEIALTKNFKLENPASSQLLASAILTELSNAKITKYEVKNGNTVSDVQLKSVKLREATVREAISGEDFSEEKIKEIVDKLG